MGTPERLAICLLLLRASVFLVMFMWTLDKIVNPAHGAAVYGHFYGIKDLGSGVMLIIAVIEMAVILLFVAGLWKAYSYGAVLVLHAISTLSSYQQYFAPFETGHLLFFAAWPMLAACFTLYYLRDSDVRLTLGTRMRL